MKKFKARPYFDKAKPKLRFVVNYTDAGKRSRRFFELKGEADTFAALKNVELQNGGVEASQFPSDLRIMASRADAVLKPYGKTIADAVAYFLPHLKAMNQTCSFSDLVAELLATKRADGASERYIGDLRSRLGQFADSFPNTSVSTFTGRQIDDWLRALPVTPITRNNSRRVLGVAFAFAVSRGYCISNPALATSKAKETEGTVGILTPEQTESLLIHAPESIVPFISIGAFAGLRRAELERLDWSNVDLESDLIQVTADKAKSAKRRFVRIQPNLAEWLRPLAKRKGPVTPSDFRERLDDARDAAGIAEWPQNALRHGFGSYSLAYENDPARVSLELGHGSPALVFKHYRELVKPKDAARYWQIVPSKAVNIVSMKAAA